MLTLSARREIAWRSAMVVLAVLLATANVALGSISRANAFGLVGCRSSRLAVGLPDRYAVGEGMTPDYRVLVDAAAPMGWRQGVRGGFQRNADFDILVIRRAITPGEHLGDAMTAYWQFCNINGYFSGYRTIIVNSVVTDGLPERQIRHMFVHEFGHHLGLGHSNYQCGVSVMYPSVGPCNGYSDPPWSDDMKGYYTIYG